MRWSRADVHDELRSRFGARIALIVGEVTGDDNLPKAVRMRLQVAHSGTLSRAARLVNLADSYPHARARSTSRRQIARLRALPPG